MYRILVIDDEKSFLGLMEDFLSSLGYSATTAECGKEGLTKFHNDYFDLVITDFSMPGMNGFDVAKHIRSSDRPDTPLLCVTGEIDLKKTEIFDQVMIKPFQIKDLKDTIKQLLVSNKGMR